MIDHSYFLWYNARRLCKINKIQQRFVCQESVIEISTFIYGSLLDLVHLKKTFDVVNRGVRELRSQGFIL